MKHILICIAALFCIATASAQQPEEMRYISATELTIVGKCMPTPQNPYHRVDLQKYCTGDAKLANKYLRPAGIAITFKTNSPAISARWELTPRNCSHNMTPIADGGLDMYIRVGKEWVFAGFASPEFSGSKLVGCKTGRMIVKNMDTTEKECMLYLPIMCEVRDLQIGVVQSATLEKGKNPFRHNIMFIGSSITHGASAPRPAMAYVAQLCRRTGLNFINLGASGECKFQDDLALIICDTDADAYVLDAFSNCTPELIRSRMIPFVEKIRATHPTTPLIFMQTLVRESTNFDRKTADFENRKRIAAEEMSAEVMARFKNVYFVAPNNLTGTDHECTTDAVHPSGLGQTRVADALLQPFCKILAKHGIK